MSSLVSAIMRSFIISLVIFCAISWTGFALNCLKCMKQNSNTCDGVSVECPHSTECVVISELYVEYDTEYHSIKKDCNPGVPCETVHYISNFANKEIKESVQCCTGEDCNTENYHMPPDPEEHHGKNCTSCLEPDLAECMSDRTVTCYHEEDKCFDFIGTFEDPGNNIVERSFKGCMSPLVCILKFGGVVGLKEIETDRLDCT